MGGQRRRESHRRTVGMKGSALRRISESPRRSCICIMLFIGISLYVDYVGIEAEQSSAVTGNRHNKH